MNFYLIKSPIFILLVFIVLSATGQQIPHTFQGKTHMMHMDEFLRLKNVGKGFTETAPPDGYIRNIAEFEKMEGVMVTYLKYSNTSGYFGIPVNLIAEMAEDAIVYTVLEDTFAMNQVITKYEAANVKMENVVFITSDINSYWSRDYGPWFIANNHQIQIVDFPYNRPRPEDDMIPAVFSEQWETRAYGMKLISTGGNYMTDGMGIAASCDLVLAENPGLSKAQVRKKVNDYLGIHTYHLLDDPLDDYIEHIDCWGKFLSVDKILITQVPTTDYRYDDFETVADYFANQLSSYGTPYKVYRVFSPNGQPYTNSLILNQKVFVPIVTGTGSSWNDEALSVYQEALPGYEVIGFTSLNDYPWESTDALHCRTHEIPDKNGIFVHHIPLHDSLAIDTREVKIAALIDAYGLNKIKEVTLFYQRNQKRYIGKKMEPEAVKNDTGLYFHNLITGMENGDTITYYIQVTDIMNQITHHPVTGELEPHRFFVKADTTDTTDTTPTFISKPEFATLKVYPNPANQRVTIIITNPIHAELTVCFYNMLGQIAKTEKVVANDDWNRCIIETQELEEGLYIMDITDGKLSEKRRISVVH